MKSTARIAGHPLHPMLIVIPAGGYIMTLIFDLLFLATDAVVWWIATIPVIAVSVIGALVAAIPGVIDLVTVARKQGALKHGITHAVLNVVILGLFIANFWQRSTTEVNPDAVTAPIWLSIIGVALLGVAGWLGWVMVQTYHVGVFEHPEARDPDPQRVRPERGELPPGEPVLP